MRRPTVRHPRLSSAGLSSLVWLLIAASAWAVPPNEREAKVRGDKAKLENDTNWIYNDWDKAVAEAKKANKPLMVILRCIPCEACSEFDDQLIRRVDEVRDLMDQFVCVR